MLKKHLKYLHQNRGFTLIEILSALTVGVILITIAAPDMTIISAKFERDAITSRLRQSVSSARQTAIRTGKTITVCGTNAQGECISDDFRSISVFIDTNRDGIINEGEKHYIHSGLNPKGRLWMTASLGRQYIRFSENGSAKQAGSFIYCQPNHSNLAARVTVSMPGRTYIAVDLDGDGRIETASGEPIDC